MRVIQGDCREALLSLDAECVDACVTDPPYGLSFMNKEWDAEVPGPEYWRQVIDVLKPGAHLLAFAGTRTQHKMASAIEAAGFEIRDVIAWVYGSGFPKSTDVSKAVDKHLGLSREVVSVDESRLRPNRVDRGLVDRSGGGGFHSDNGATVTAPASPEAAQWEGWGTALKPSMELVTVARKPLAGTVAANVLEHGTGALNIDGCGIPVDSGDEWDKPQSQVRPGGSDRGHALGTGKGRLEGVRGTPRPSGRWPANLIHDGSDDVEALFQNASSGKYPAARKDGGIPTSGHRGQSGLESSRTPPGTAARFFYCAKAGKADRFGGDHPTVKPVELMRYLVRLVTPPGGVVLDPFAGTGTTGEAALLEGFDAVLVERDPGYARLCAERLAEDVETV